MRDSDHSLAAHLLRIKDPETGTGLSDELLAGEIGMFFTAGTPPPLPSPGTSPAPVAQVPYAIATACACVYQHMAAARSDRQEFGT